MKTFDNGSARAQNHIRKSRKLPFKAEILVMSYMRNFFSGTNLIPSWVLIPCISNLQGSKYPSNKFYIYTYILHSQKQQETPFNNQRKQKNQTH